MGRIDPKWDKSGTFQIKFSDQFWPVDSKCTGICSKKKSGFIPFGYHFGPNPHCTQKPNRQLVATVVMGELDEATTLLDLIIDLKDIHLT